MLKRHGAIFLAAILTMSALVSCSGAESQSQPEQSAAETQLQTEQTSETGEEPQLPDEDYGGYEFRIINRVYGYSCYNFERQTAEAETGELLNDAVYRRDLSVSERYNVAFTETDDDNAASKLKKTILAGDDAFDLGMARIGDFSSIIEPGLFADFNSLPNVDLTKSWWDQNAKSDLSVSGVLPWMASDMQITHKDTAVIIYFNKKLAENYALPDLYQCVRDGGWTYDRFSEATANVKTDLNGDGSFDKEDLWPMCGWNGITYPQFYVGAGELSVTKDQSDYPVLNLGGVRFIEVFDRECSLLSDCKIPDASKNADHLVMFAADQSLFFSATLGETKEFRDMETDYGIIPAPKYDEAQESYHTYVDAPVVMCVPSTSGDLSRTGLLLEALSYEGHAGVVPTYYDTMLKSKYIRDEETVEMLDLYIMPGLAYDIGRSVISDIGAAIYTIPGTTNTLSSIAAANESKFGESLKKYAESITG